MSDLYICKACGAPIELSLQILEKEGSEPTKCVFCSAPIGSKYRPFEIKVLKRRNSRNTMIFLLPILLPVFAVLFALGARTTWQTYSCLSRSPVERLVSGCIQPSALSASAVNLRVREDLTLPEQHQLVQAVLLSNVRRLQFKRGDQFLFDTDASATPLRLSASGDWLLLKHDNQELYIYRVAGSQTAPIRLDLQACQPSASASSVNFSWSPDGQRMLISAISDGVRRVKLATLNMQAARLERCDEVYSQNVSSVAWLSDNYLLYLIEEGGRKRLELRAINSAQLVFSSELQLVISTLDNLQVSPSGQHVLFTGEDLSGQKQLYWLNFSEQPALHILQSAEQPIYPSKFFGWANEYQVAYLNDEGRLVLINLQAQAVSFIAMPPNVVWIAWQGAN